MFSWVDRKSPALAALILLSLCAAACVAADQREPGPGPAPSKAAGFLDAKPVAYYGYGTTATAREIAGWDIDVNADGEGLPPGSGSVEDGEVLYDALCSDCHGSFGEGANGFPALSGGEGSLRDTRPKRTIGSYWKYASTLWDYIHRAMPFQSPESLSDNEVYAISAYVLFLNDLVADDFVLSQINLSTVHLPNEDSFYADSRPDTSNTRCMHDCRDPASIRIVSEAAPTDDSGNPISAQRTRAEPVQVSRRRK